MSTVIFFLTNKHAAFQIHCSIADTSFFGKKMEKENSNF